MKQPTATLLTLIKFPMSRKKKKKKREIVNDFFHHTQTHFLPDVSHSTYPLTCAMLIYNIIFKLRDGGKKE